MLLLIGFCLGVQFGLLYNQQFATFSIIQRISCLQITCLSSLVSIREHKSIEMREYLHTNAEIIRSNFLLDQWLSLYYEEDCIERSHTGLKVGPMLKPRQCDLKKCILNHNGLTLLHKYWVLNTRNTCRVTWEEC